MKAAVDKEKAKEEMMAKEEGVALGAPPVEMRKGLGGAMGKRTRKAWSLLVALVLISIRAANGLYQDQAGVNDWKLQHVGKANLAVFAKSKIYVGTEKGVLAALESKTGEIVWRVVLPKQDGAVDAMDFEKKRLVTLSKRGTVVRVFDPVKGKMVWDVELPGGIQCGALKLVQDDLVLCWGDHDVVGLNIKTGKLLWKWKTEKGLKVTDAQVGTAVSVAGVRNDTVVIVTLGLRDGKETGDVSYESLKEATKPLAGPRFLKGGRQVTLLTDNALTILDVSKKLVVDSKDLGKLEPGIKMNVRETDTDDCPISNAIIIGGWSFFVDSKTGKLEGISSIHTSTLDVSCKITGSKSQNEASILGVGHGTMPFVEWVGPGSKAAIKLDIPFEKQRGRAESVYTQFSSAPSARAVVQFEDGGLVALVVRDGEVQVLWEREEGLAYVSIQPVSFELPHIVTASSESEFEELMDIDENSGMNLHTHRFKHQITSLIGASKELVQSVMGFFKMVVETKGEILVKAYRGELARSGYSEKEKTIFGFRRAVVLVSDLGSVYAMESETGRIMWRFFDEDLAKDPRSWVFITRARHSGHLNPEFAIIRRNGKFEQYNAMNGNLVSSEQVLESGKVFNEVMGLRIGGVEQSDDIHREFLAIGLTSDDFISVFPKDRQGLITPELAKNVRLFTVLPNKKGVVGFGVPQGLSGRGIELWSVSVPSTHEIVKVQTHPNDPVNSPGRKIGDGSLLVKHVNPHLVAMTSVDEDGMLLTLFDAITGKITQRFTFKGFTTPVNIAMYEQVIVLTAWNRAMKRTDVATIALYEGKIDKYELNPFSGSSVSGNETQSSFDPKSGLFVLQRGFFSDRAITALGVTTTRLGISERNVIFALENGVVNAMDQRFLDPRRPMGKPTPQETEEGLLAYYPELPFIPYFTFTYTHAIERVKIIYTMPTKLESTCLVLVVGLDMFYFRITPSGGFDLLSEDFNHALLILLTTVLAIATLIMQGAVQRKMLQQQWK